MKWFRKLSCENMAGQANNNNKVHERHKRIKKTIVIPTIKCMELEECCEAMRMTTSLCGVEFEQIQILDPEDFFDDPVHVSNYREEATFLNLMSEWEIIENPSMSENYFSADFEDELVQFRTQSDSSLSSAGASCLSISTISTNFEKLTFAEFLFADKIQLGIFVPLSMSKQYAKETKNRLSRKRITIQTQTDTSTQTDLVCKICYRHLIKDYAIERTQFETEAYACSIMGAIRKAPQRDILYNSERNLWECCKYNCDHYDIKKLFHLDEEGNILLNMSHIEEISGYGFTVSQQNKRFYKNCLKHAQLASDTDYCSNSCLNALRRTLQLVWNLVCGHPRNKVNIYGSTGPGDSVRSYTLQLAQDSTSTFSRNIENFISCTKESREAAPQVVMRNMRQFMNGMKNYLVKHGEGKFQQEVEIARARLKSDEFLNLDAILETVMHKLVVLPLREHLYGMFVEYYTSTEDIQLLAQNVKYACGRCAADFGIRASVTPPSCYSLNLISNILLRLQEAELPLEKLDLFLSVITTIFEATGCPRGQQLGADDFLPILVYVVAKCGFVGAEIEAEFMWGLLQPTLLNGEPGYYLTALCSAVHVLKSFMASENENGSSSLDVSE